MKRLLVTLVCIIASPSVAQTSDLDARCKSMGDLAANVMKSRQMEAPISELMEFGKSLSEGTRNAHRAMVLAAYDEVGYRTKENQGQAIAEFRNKVELACYRDG